MKSWSQGLLLGLLVAVMMGLSMSAVQAQSNDLTATGVNTLGRPGYFFSDTAYAPEKNQIMGSGSVLFYTQGSQLTIPVGASYGLTNHIQLAVDSSFYSDNGTSGFNNLTFGGKYNFKTKVERLWLAVGLDLSAGPLSGSSYSSFNFDPYGVITYTFEDGLQLNGQLGIMLLGGYNIDNPFYGEAGQAKTISIGGSSYAQFNAGASYPLGDQLTGIAELDVNGLGSGSSPLIAGIRVGHAVQLQAFGGLDLASNVGVVLGGSVGLISE